MAILAHAIIKRKGLGRGLIVNDSRREWCQHGAEDRGINGDYTSVLYIPFKLKERVA